jgi:hypothetical protein
VQIEHSTIDWPPPAGKLRGQCSRLAEGKGIIRLHDGKFGRIIPDGGGCLFILLPRLKPGFSTGKVSVLGEATGARRDESEHGFSKDGINFVA